MGNPTNVTNENKSDDSKKVKPDPWLMTFWMVFLMLVLLFFCMPWSLGAIQIIKYFLERG